MCEYCEFKLMERDDKDGDYYECPNELDVSFDVDCEAELSLIAYEGRASAFINFHFEDDSEDKVHISAFGQEHEYKYDRSFSFGGVVSINYCPMCGRDLRGEEC